MAKSIAKRLYEQVNLAVVITTAFLVAVTTFFVTRSNLESQIADLRSKVEYLSRIRRYLLESEIRAEMGILGQLDREATNLSESIMTWNKVSDRSYLVIINEGQPAAQYTDIISQMSSESIILSLSDGQIATDLITLVRLLNDYNGLIFETYPEDSRLQLQFTQGSALQVYSELRADEQKVFATKSDAVVKQIKTLLNILSPRVRGEIARVRNMLESIPKAPDP